MPTSILKTGRVLDRFINLVLVDSLLHDIDTYLRYHPLDALIVFFFRLFHTFVFNFQSISGTHLLCKTLSSPYGSLTWWRLCGDPDTSFSRSVCSAAFVSSHKLRLALETTNPCNVM